MNLKSVNSSHISATGYDHDKRVMTVVFKNGTTYEYGGVDGDAWMGMANAESKGRYLREMQKSGRHIARKLP